MGIGKIFYSTMLVGALALASGIGGGVLTYKNHSKIQEEINVRKGVSYEYGPGDTVVFQKDEQGNTHKYLQTRQGLVEIGRDNVPADINIVVQNLSERPGKEVFEGIAQLIDSEDSVVRKKLQESFAEDPGYVVEMTERGIKEYPERIAEMPYEDLIPVGKELMNRLPPELAAKAKDFMPSTEGDSSDQKNSPDGKPRPDSEKMEFLYDVWKYYSEGGR